MWKGAPLRTNALGLAQGAPEAPAAGRRVAVLGDSFTLPAGAPRERSWLEPLREAFPRFEFVNLGVPGYGLRQYAASARLKGELYAPERYIVAWCDDNDHVPEPEAEPYRAPAPRSGLRRSWFLALLKHVASPPPAHPPGYTEEERAWIREGFRRIKAATRGKPVLVARLSGAPGHAAELPALAAEAGFAFADGADAFAGEDARTLVIAHPLDGHPNARGHRLLAAKLARDPELAAFLR